MKARVGVGKAIRVHVLPQSRVAKESLNLSEVTSMKLAGDLALREDGEALVDPEVLPIAASNIVASP